MSIWGHADGWIAIAGLAIGTFLIRYSFIGLLAGKKLPPRFERALQLAVPAIFAALVVPLVIMLGSVANLDQRWPHAVAAIVTGIYAGWRGGMFVPLVVGMGTLHALFLLTKL
jgi:branched-subunit amino acid transport protein